MENSSIISINIVVLNGAKYMRHCLDAVLNQTFDHSQISVRILDNGSTDGTQEIIAKYLAKMDDFHGAHFIQSTRNYGMWGGQEELLKQGREPYVVFLSADIIMDNDFIKQALMEMNKDEEIGALQAKILQFRLEGEQVKKLDVIDTCGFQIFHSRKILNIGQGETDKGQYQNWREVFGIEGAAPVFRRSALESIRILGEIADHDLFWYGEDVDVAWRLRLAGWHQIYTPTIIAWHDRGTAKSQASGYWWKHLARVKERQQIAIQRRRLEWRNTRLTRIKNDYIINVLKDLPMIIWREVEILVYSFLFEPAVLTEIPNLFRLLPRMLTKRRAIMRSAKLSPAETRLYFQ